MYRLSNLIKNEYIKIFSRPFYTVMLIVVVLLPFVSGGRIQEGYSDNLYPAPYYVLPDCNAMIAGERSQEKPGWQIRVWMYQFIRHNIDTDDWRVEAAYKTYEIRMIAAYRDTTEQRKDAAMKSYETMRAAVAGNDYIEFLKAEIEMIKSEVLHEYPRQLKDIMIGPVYKTDWYGERLEEILLWEPTYRLEHGIVLRHDDWRSEIISGIGGVKLDIYANSSDPNLLRYTDRELIALNRSIHIALYRVENHIQNYTMLQDGNYISSDHSRFWARFSLSVPLLMFITIFVMIPASGIVSSEYSTGTIRLLLANPIGRLKIFAAKYLTIISIAAALVFIYYILSLFISIFYGAYTPGMTHIYAEPSFSPDDTIYIRAYGAFWFITLRYLLNSLCMLTMITFVFMLGTFTSNTAVITGIGTALPFVCNPSVIGIIFGNHGLGYLFKFLPFPNLDINMIAMESSPIPGHTIEWAIAVNIICIAVSLLLARKGAMRDV
ncbi:MAG: ABC transporter permease [Oscillospiraceae bacterium]|nr:ABC transporter permease [Oscillospiraceae bacterium]